MATDIVTNWFDELEGVLAAEAKLAGLLQHNSTIGQAREFLVTRVLRTILPTSVHFGSGKVIDHRGNSSKQIDIVVYDPRFPLLQTAGGGLYFVEGVLAAIEVKSTINSEQLRQGLENCASVLRLGVNGECPEQAESRIKFYMERERLTHSQAEQRFWYRLRPATYVFGFTSAITSSSAAEQTADWLKSDGGSSPYFPLLPRLMVVGDVVGVVNDGRFTVQSKNAPAPGTHRVASVFRTSRRFRWFAMHIMDCISSRLGLRNYAEECDYRIHSYVNLVNYVSEIEQNEVKFIDLTVGSAAPAP